MHQYALSTPRLKMRPIESSDAVLLWPYVSNPAISENMSWEYHKDISVTHNFIEDTIKNMESGKTMTWCIFFENRFCGIFSLIAILRRHRNLTYDRAELAYWLGPEFQHKGIMTEAGNEIIAFAFDKMKLHKLVVGHHIENTSSEALILRLGFKYHYTEEAVFKKNDKWITCKFYELFSSIYNEK